MVLWFQGPCRQQFLFLFPFHFFFFKFTPVCNLSWIANHIKILIFIGALFFHKFVILLLVIMPLNIKFLYINRVEYFLDSSTSQVYSSSNSLAWIWKESKTSISLSHHLGPKDLVNLTFHPSPAQQYATKHLLSSHMKNKLGNSNFKGILPAQISSQNKVLLPLLTLEIKPHFTEFFCLYHPFLEL